MGSEIIEIVERRRRWPVEVKLKILNEVLQPGASVSAVADRHGVSRALVYQWLNQVRAGRIAGLAMKPEARTAFVPLQVEPDEPGQTAGDVTAPSTPRVPTRHRAPTRIEITLRNGRVVTAEDSIDPAALARIVTTLDAPEAS